MNLWPFRRRKPDVPPVETNHEWAVGDLGECIDDGWSHQWPDNPEAGDLVKVSALVWFDQPVENSPSGLYLRLGNIDDRCWSAVAFRKLVIQHEPASAEFTASIRDRKPVPTLEPTSRRSEPVYGWVDNGRIRFVPR